MTLAQLIEARTKAQLKNYTPEALERVKARLEEKGDPTGAAQWVEDVLK